MLVRALLLALGAIGLTAHVSGEEWSRFRGPNGSGLAPASMAPAAWTDADYNWRAPLPGVGHSSPVLWGGRLFVTSADEEAGTRWAVALDAHSGKELWRREFAGRPHAQHALNRIASSTPAVDESRVYCCFTGPEGSQLHALDHDGLDVWTFDLGAFVSGHGGGVSPIVEGELVVLAAEHQGDGFLIALDRVTGNERWRIARESSLHYATPCRHRRSGGRVELIFTNWEQGITAVTPETGAIAWQADIFDKRHIESAIASPIVVGDMLWATCGWLAVRQEVVAYSLASDGGGATGKQYTIDRSAPLCVTPIVRDDLLFLWADEGIVTCASAADGEVFWRRRVGGQFYSSPICVGDRLYNTSTDGDVLCLAASREFRLLGKSRIENPSHAVPAVAGDVLYFRGLSEVLSVGGSLGQN